MLWRVWCWHLPLAGGKEQGTGTLRRTARAEGWTCLVTQSFPSWVCTGVCVCMCDTCRPVICTDLAVLGMNVCDCNTHVPRSECCVITHVHLQLTHIRDVNMRIPVYTNTCVTVYCMHIWVHTDTYRPCVHACVCTHVPGSKCTVNVHLCPAATLNPCVCVTQVCNHLGEITWPTRKKNCIQLSYHSAGKRVHEL